MRPLREGRGKSARVVKGRQGRLRGESKGSEEEAAGGGAPFPPPLNKAGGDTRSGHGR